MTFRARACEPCGRLGSGLMDGCQAFPDREVFETFRRSSAMPFSAAGRMSCQLFGLPPPPPLVISSLLRFAVIDLHF